jgi:hypothetical protein
MASPALEVPMLISGELRNLGQAEADPAGVGAPGGVDQPGGGDH